MSVREIAYLKRGSRHVPRLLLATDDGHCLEATVRLGTEKAFAAALGARARAAAGEALRDLDEPPR